MENNYNYQREWNISCLLEDEEYEERRIVLLQLVKMFEEENVQWGLGCSTNLFLRGIVDEFHDFDMIVDISDINKVSKIMNSLNATLVATGGNGFCESDIYMHYQLGRVDVDIIANFRVKTFETEYVYQYSPKEIEYCKIYEETQIVIPLITVEALYVLYCMMEGWQAKRRFKRMLLQEYLKEELNFREVLEESLLQPLPSWIKRNVRELLKK